MRPSVSLYLLALIFLFQISTLSASSTLKKVCNFLGGDYVTPKYCINTLKTDPRSRSADAQGLGVIAVQLTTTKATVIKSKLEELLKNASSPHADKALEACHQLYSDLIPSLKWAANSMASKLNRGAKAVLNVAISVPASCDELGVQSISKDGNAFSNLTNLARAIARYLVA
ncbi:putative invertase inhibitor [Elaeis guineensis]|uniref:Invertase inhibitor n=1 Tax=Elaeis guineensis var. tenera TaxID=51953 RepID=A0A6I9SBH4_ELAGV|nr:putative invertase inhibitor [Elaeis guineensis]